MAQESRKVRSEREGIESVRSKRETESERERLKERREISGLERMSVRSKHLERRKGGKKKRKGSCWFRSSTGSPMLGMLSPALGF